MKLIVGLGNPGKAYVNSRHNLGFQCINQFAREHTITWKGRRAKARVANGVVAGTFVILAKPSTFMNLSGNSVGSLMRYYKITLSDLLVIYDDLDFPLGTIKLRQGGGSGGHNGIKSIIDHVGSQDFPRIRVGIGQLTDENPSDLPRPNQKVSYVLGHFTAREKLVVVEVCTQVAKAIHSFLSQGIDTAMNKYNSR